MEYGQQQGSSSPTRPRILVEQTSRDATTTSNMNGTVLSTKRRHSQDVTDDLSDEEVASQLGMRHQQGPEGYFDEADEDNVDGDDDGEREDDQLGLAEDDEEGSASFSDSLSSSPSIPDEDIDFSLVYALHTFLATVDGQASVVKGDKLLLLDDTNSYWWLVRVLKTQHVGYIPAENIETPYERLARLNKHRNVDLTTVTHEDVMTGPSSALAQTRFAQRIPPSKQPHPHESRHPYAKGTPASPSHKDHPVNMSPLRERHRIQGSSSKSVGFTAPTYYEHSGNEESAEGDEMDHEDDEEAPHEHAGQTAHQVFDDDEESDFSQEADADEEPVQRRADVDQTPMQQAQYDEGHEADVEDDDTQQTLSTAPIAASSPAERNNRPASGDKDRPYDWRRDEEVVNFDQPRESDESFERRQVEAQSIKNRQFDETSFSRDAPTKKLTATPPIVRDETFDINNPYADLPGGKARSGSPVRVNGVELLNPSDPKYHKLMPDKRQREEYGVAPVHYEAAQMFASTTSAASADTQGASSIMSTTGSDDSHRNPVGYTMPSASKKLKKANREPVEGNVDKKKKSSGILGLFRKKDKKKGKADDNEQGRSSEELVGMSPVASNDHSASLESSSGVRSSNRLSQTSESIFSMDATLRQQEIEAKQALLTQYGVQRAPGDLVNTMTPRSQSQLSPASAGLSPSSALASPPISRIRPGSLMGSPSIPGVEVPLLNVLRVFAGDDIESDSSFKTVLLSSATSAADLVKQAMQRFRLIDGQDLNNYCLTIKELGGEERELSPDEKPLVVFESLSDSPDGSHLSVPAVKRSSVGSIDSIASNLSQNPAISRLGMNDFSDDSVVKVYLHKRRQGSLATVPPTAAVAGGEPASQTSYRFAVKLLLHAADLPDNVIFDPHSNAIVPNVMVQERKERSSSLVSPSGDDDDDEVLDPTLRERIVFLPRNVTVSEAVEAALDKFGIYDGMIDGGDDVDEKLTRRKSASRAKYSLCVLRNGTESTLPPGAKLVEAYEEPPVFRSYERSSKESKRRSLDATLILGSSGDLQPTDPVFVLRKSSHRSSGSSAKFGGGVPADEIALKRLSIDRRGDGVPKRTDANRASVNGVPSAPEGDVAPLDRDIDALSRSKMTRQEIITAQRAATRATQLSAQRNAERGIDVTMPGEGTIRSSRLSAMDPVRYSYIDVDGQEADITGIIQDEWQPEPASTRQHASGRPAQTGRTASDADSFRTALPSPLSTDAETSDFEQTQTVDDDEEQAVSALRSADIMIDSAQRGRDGPTDPRDQGKDVLQGALSQRGTETEPQGSLHDRLDRVMARVREDRLNMANGQDSSGGATPIQQRSTSSNQASPVVTSDQERLSPALSNERTMSPLAAQQDPRATIVSPSRHAKKGSTGSVASSSQQSLSRTGSPATNSTSPSNPLSAFTPTSSSESRTSNHRQGIVYRDDFGLDLLMAIVEADAYKAPKQRDADPVHEMLFGPSLDELDLHPEVKQWYAGPKRSIDDIERRLDALLLQTGL